MERPVAKYVMTMTWLIIDPPAANPSDSTPETAASQLHALNNYVYLFRCLQYHSRIYEL